MYFVSHPRAGCRNLFAFPHCLRFADDGYLVELPEREAGGEFDMEDGVAVLVVVEDDRLDRSLNSLARFICHL